LGGLVGLGGRKVRQDVPQVFSPAINVFLQLHVDSVCYISCGYSTVRLAHSFIDVQIHTNISTHIYIYIYITL
jgi:hypothetical protein